MPAISGQMGMTVELPVSTPELVEALHRDRESLVRDALLWQRWVRYAGLAAIVLLAFLLGERPRAEMATPLALTALLYALCVTLMGEWARRARTMHNSWIPATLVTADIVALAAVVHASGG